MRYSILSFVSCGAAYLYHLSCVVRYNAHPCRNHAVQYTISLVQYCAVNRSFCVVRYSISSSLLCRAVQPTFYPVQCGTALPSIFCRAAQHTFSLVSFGTAYFVSCVVRNSIKGPSKNYVTLFLRILDPSPLFALVSQVDKPLPFLRHAKCDHLSNTVY